MTTTTATPWWVRWREAEGATILHVDLTPDAEREACAVALLDGAERSRRRRFLAARARREFALCRAALRVVLAERLGCSKRQLSFGYLEHGKPFAMVDGRRADIGFNVSHSGRHGLIAIAEHRPAAAPEHGRVEQLGVDVEERRPRKDLEGIGSLVFSPAERRLLAAAADDNRRRLFYRFWSLKEALIKAVGTGFSRSPRGIEIPAPMLRGARTGEFRFSDSPAETWRLVDLGERRFAAALAWRMPDSPVSS